MENRGRSNSEPTSVVLTQELRCANVNCDSLVLLCGSQALRRGQQGKLLLPLPPTFTARLAVATSLSV